MGTRAKKRTTCRDVQVWKNRGREWLVGRETCRRTCVDGCLCMARLHSRKQAWPCILPYMEVVDILISIMAPKPAVHFQPDSPFFHPYLLPHPLSLNSLPLAPLTPPLLRLITSLPTTTISLAKHAPNHSSPHQVRS